MIFSKQKKSEDGKVVEERNNLKDIVVLLMTVVGRVIKMVALAVTQEVVKVIAKTESNLALSPSETTCHGQLTACTYYLVIRCCATSMQLMPCQI